MAATVAVAVSGAAAAAVAKHQALSGLQQLIDSTRDGSSSLQKKQRYYDISLYAIETLP